MTAQLATSEEVFRSMSESEYLTIATDCTSVCCVISVVMTSSADLKASRLKIN